MRWNYKAFNNEQEVVDFLNKYSEHLNDIQIICRDALYIVFYRTSLLSI